MSTDLSNRKQFWQVSSSLGFATLLTFLVLVLAACNQQNTKAVSREAAADKKKAQPGAANTDQKAFSSPSDAGAALFDAAQSNDRNAILAVLGSDGKDLLSADPQKDKVMLQAFVDAYRQMHRWSPSKAGGEVLYIGADNFPFPIPVDKTTSGQWAFNTAAGKDEILARRIGDGELTAIGRLSEIANAEMEYYSRTHEFTARFVSDEGRQNGLYWPVAEGQAPSPLASWGGDVAEALGSTGASPQPLNGYYYKLLTTQEGGSGEYVKNGTSTGRFAVVAWPAGYGDSGIFTFFVGEDGAVYEKDLGKNTSEAASAITEVSPGEGWTVVLAPEPTNPRGLKYAKK